MDIRVNEVAEIIRKKGFNAESTEILKNGVLLDAICIKRKDTNIAPTIYMESILEKAERFGDSLEKVADEVIEIDKAHRKEKIDISFINDKEYILSHVSIALQKESGEELIKRECGLEGIESYLYIKVDIDGIGGTIKLNKRIVENVCITETELWKRAEKNLHTETVIKPLFNMISEMLGTDEKSSDDECGMYVITNKSLVNGASAVLDKKALRKIAERHGVNELYILPSSRHEMIIIPYRDGINIDALSTMVREVNTSQVEEVDRLTDTAYKIAV